MEPKLIVMITTLLLPNGDSSVNVKPFATAAICHEAANIEISDPFVAGAECAVLENGEVTLQFKRDAIEQMLQQTKIKIGN
jgi:hypothetical protein